MSEAVPPGSDVRVRTFDGIEWISASDLIDYLEEQFEFQTSKDPATIEANIKAQTCAWLSVTIRMAVKRERAKIGEP